MLELLPTRQIFPVPPTGVDLTSYPRRGATIGAGLLMSTFDYRGWARLLGSIFGTRGWTQVNVFSARWPDVDPVACWPWLKRPDGKFDLYAKNPAFWQDRLPRYIEAMNRQSVVVQLCLLNLYQFSDRKPGTPDKNLDPFRYNVNGVYYRGDDDFLSKELKTEPFLLWFARELAAAVTGAGVAFVPFNEGPEKPVHHAIADAIFSVWPEARIVYNRNEDTPGQYQNQIRSGQPREMLAYHGWKDLSFLTTPFEPSAEELRDRPLDAVKRPWNFTEFFANRRHDGQPAGIDFTRVVCSSDGSRISNDPIHTYNTTELLKVFAYCAKHKVTIEHQERAKMTPGAPLAMVDVPFLKQIAALKEA